MPDIPEPVVHYGLKYYAEFKNVRNHNFRLEIKENSYFGGSTEIGDLSGCVLEVQGNLSDVISPIVKTQLRFTVVDAPDMNGSKKFGNWQEFFTPSATLYKVILYSGVSAIWSGYITPDSWTENLDYHGEITVVARDNLGHLQDFAFDLEGNTDGLVKIEDIIKGAMSKISMPMSVSYDQSNSPSANGTSIWDAYVNVSLFKDMNWYDVLERTLEATGLVVRYMGGNTVAVTALRNIATSSSPQTLEFYGGTMELDPAVKRIVEEQDYKVQKEVGLPVFDGLEFSSSYGTYRCKTDGNTMPGGGSFSIPEHDADYKTNTSRGKTGWNVGSAMLDPGTESPDTFLIREEGDNGWSKYAFLAVNQQSAVSATYRFKTRTAGVRITFRFTPNALTKKIGNGLMEKDNYTLANVKYSVKYTNGTTTSYWNGAGWVSSRETVSVDYDSQNKAETDLVIEMSECTDISGGGEMFVTIEEMTYKMSYGGGYGCYARVAYIGVEINAQKVLQSNKITTINNDAYNVMLTRRPLFGAMSRSMGFVKPANYQGAIFYYPYSGADPELFPYLVGSVPLPVAIHQQILCFFYGAARALNGNCAPINKGLFSFSNSATYKGHNYILQGGTFDCFSGIVQGAIFREFVTFSSLWGGGAPSWSEGGNEEDFYNDNGSGSSSGSSSGGSNGSSGGFNPNYEVNTNKVTSVSAQSTDVQYPSAKLLYDTVGNIETLLAAL